MMTLLQKFRDELHCSTHEYRLSYQGVGFEAKQVGNHKHQRCEHARGHGRVEGIK